MQLHPFIDKVRAAGGELYVIGSGAPSFIAGFREQTKYDGPIYTDPTLAAYQAAQLERGVMRTFNPLAIGATVRALRNGSRQGSKQGDNFQQGGALAIDTDGSVLWQQISKRPGDHARGEELVEAISRSRAQP